jgi:predicted Zn-dependent protease with MMP-like domain
MRLSQKEFDRIVKQAIRRIPREIRTHLENILITVQIRPSPELLGEMDLSPDEPLLGIYQGTPLPERSEMEPPLYPDSIVLFQEPIEAMCDSLEDMKREIEITVVHEVAHFLGISDERLSDLGYG